MDKIIKIIKENKKIILILPIILIIILLFIPVSKKDVELVDENIYIHKEKEIIKEEEYGGIKFTDISMTTINGYTTFTANATNIKNEDIKKELLHIELKDKNDNTVIRLLAYIPDGLKVGETKKITSSAKGEFKNVVAKAVTE